MINENYEMEAVLKKSDDKNAKGEEMAYFVFTAKDALDEQMKFKDNSYVYVGKDKVAVISHIVNFDAKTTLVKLQGKKSVAMILGTHIYLPVTGVRQRFEEFAEIMDNIDNWIKIPDHDASSDKFMSALRSM